MCMSREREEEKDEQKCSINRNISLYLFVYFTVGHRHNKSVVEEKISRRKVFVVKVFIIFFKRVYMP